MPETITPSFSDLVRMADAAPDKSIIVKGGGFKAVLQEAETNETFEYVMMAKKVDKTNIISPSTKIGKALKDQGVGDVIDGSVFGREHDCTITAILKAQA